MFKTLFLRMLAAYLAASFAGIVMLGLAASRIFSSNYFNTTEDQLSREAYEINRMVYEEYLDDAKRDVAKEKLFAVVRQSNGLLQLYFDDPTLGTTSFYDYLEGQKWYISIETDFSSLDRPNDGKVEERFYYDLLGEDMKMRTLTIVRPIITESGSKAGMMLLHYDITNTHSVLGVLYKDIFMAAAGILLIIAFITVIITKRMTKPISHMTDVVHAFSRGSYDARVTISHDDELGKLGESFNEMAEKVAGLEQTRREFVSNVSHELRSPLTSMRGFLEAMEDGVIPPEEHEKYIGVVLDETKRMSTIVNDLLDLARIESGQYRLEFSTFEVSELIGRVLLSFENRISAAGIDVDVKFPDTALFVSADEERIKQVLHNLIDNAIKFMPNENARLTVIVTTDRHKVVVSVCDNGAGINDEDVAKIFDRFYKAEKAHTYRSGSGTGLGLAIVKRIMDQHDEDIYVNSRPGATRFSFTLRRVPPPIKYAQ